MAVNAALASIKILAVFFGNSYTLIADGIESTSDIVTSLVVWGGLRVSVAPADERHPYCYGKAEALSGIVASLALLAAAGMIAVQSVREIRTPHHLPHWSTLLVLVLVVATKAILARWMAGIGEEAESTSLQADVWHHWADALTSIAAFLGITIGLIGGPGYEPADDWAALLACVVIVFSGLSLLRIAVRELLDVAPAKEFEGKVRELALGVPGVRALDKCRIRKSGVPATSWNCTSRSTGRPGWLRPREVRSLHTSANHSSLRPFRPPAACPPTGPSTSRPMTNATRFNRRPTMCR